MSKISCIVIEDEPPAVRMLVDYISQVPFLELKGTFKDALQATEYLRHHSIELIFLDIHLPKLKGMSFLKTLAHPPAIIITTAYHQYAVEGFNQNVTDYLLKPFDFERFLVAVNKVKAGKSDHALIEGREIRDYIFISVQKKKVKLSYPEIIYVESQREYVKIVTTKKTYLTKISTSEIESALPTNQFKRVHRSFIISISKIESYTADTVEVNGISVPVGRGYKEALESLLN